MKEQFGVNHPFYSVTIAVSGGMVTGLVTGWSTFRAQQEQPIIDAAQNSSGTTTTTVEYNNITTPGTQSQVSQEMQYTPIKPGEVDPLQIAVLGLLGFAVGAVGINYLFGGKKRTVQ